MMVMTMVMMVDDDDYDDDDDSGWPMVGDLLVVERGHREATVPMLIVNCFAEIQNLGRC